MKGQDKLRSLRDLVEVAYTSIFVQSAEKKILLENMNFAYAKPVRS